MGVGYSYIAAFIFNLLVVEWPKAKAFRGHYEAAWSELSELMGTPPYMIKAVYQLACCDELKTSVGSVEELQDVLSRIDLAKFEADRFEKDNALAMLEHYHHNAYRSLTPILYGFEPQVSVAVVRRGRPSRRRQDPREHCQYEADGFVVEDAHRVRYLGEESVPVPGSGPSAAPGIGKLQLHTGP
jgi:hypothetical protein